METARTKAIAEYVAEQIDAALRALEKGKVEEAKIILHEVFVEASRDFSDEE